MTTHRFNVATTNIHYEGPYEERELRWRSVCAHDKARNLADLLGPRVAEVETVLEVGVGTGAVLLETRDRGVGTVHQGIDVADPHVHPDTRVNKGGVTLSEYDGRTIPFADASFDLVYASHVLEHVPDERGFLSEIKRVAKRYIYIEVPCELHLRATAPALQRTLDIGHINAYTPETLALTLATSGLTVIEQRVFDHSLAVHAFGASTAKARIKKAVRGAVLKANPFLASRLFTYHAGALCRA